jgi:hypothetical protein
MTMWRVPLILTLLWSWISPAASFQAAVNLPISVRIQRQSQMSSNNKSALHMGVFDLFGGSVRIPKSPADR